MVETIVNKAGQGGDIMVARMKFGKSTAVSLSTDMTKAERQLSDIIDIGSSAQDRAQKTRKLDGYLRLFQSAIKAFGGTSSRYVSPYSPVEIEYLKMKNPYLKRTDTTV